MKAALVALAILAVACGTSTDGPDPEQGKGDTECPAGLTSCGGTCVDLQTDPNHRGACGIKVCGGLGEPCCDPAVTGGPACFDIRGANNTCCGGTCVDLQTDPNHHGACGNVLPQ